nr:hypothetical protein [Micromonospora sp. DSM 115978]
MTDADADDPADQAEDETARVILDRVRAAWGPGAVDPDEQDVP